MERYKILQCCNPLKKDYHSVRDKKRLRNVTAWMCASYPDLDKLSKICDKCRKEVSLIKEKEQQNGSNSSSDEGNDPNFTVPQSVVVNTLNSSLVQLGESLVDCKKIKSKEYSARKIKKIECAVK